MEMPASLEFLRLRFGNMSSQVVQKAGKLEGSSKELNRHGGETEGQGQVLGLSDI